MDSTGGGRIRLNVGGKLFETTVSTLQSAGPDSLLAALSNRPEPVFIDRDPDVFSVLLSLLRSSRLPSYSSRRFTPQELADEALYYGLDSLLRVALSPPPLSGIDASVVATVRPAADALPTSFSPGADGSLWLAHGGQISVYDWSLAHAATLRTHLDAVTSLRRVCPDIAAAGSDSAAGVHFYHVAGARHVGSVHWSDPSDPRVYKARVTAVSDSDGAVFAAFECPHRENCVLVIDKATLKATSEIGRHPGTSVKSSVPEKLTYLPENGLLFGCTVHAGAFGCSGYVRLWDLRAGSIVWETNEPGSGRSSRFGDSFADVDVDTDTGRMFKVCSKSGDIGVADLRKLGDDPWVYLEEENPNLRNVGGSGSSLVHCYKGQVFVGRDGSLEVWSSVNGEGLESVCKNTYKRNFVDKEEVASKGVIRKMEGGGERLFVSREGVEGIEVWETSTASGFISVS